MAIAARFLAVGALAGLAACASEPMHEKEGFDPNTPFQYRIPAELDRACEAARLALLSQGYAAEEVRPHQLKATKAFQPDDESHVMIEFNVVCAATRKGTTVYANALEKRYELKKDTTAAGISVPSLGSISLPWGSSSESLVLVASQTVSAPDFYQRYYGLIRQQLGIGAGQ
jgi:hypothetical protein